MSFVISCEKEEPPPTILILVIFTFLNTSKNKQTSKNTKKKESACELCSGGLVNGLLACHWARDCQYEGKGGTLSDWLSIQLPVNPSCLNKTTNLQLEPSHWKFLKFQAWCSIAESINGPFVSTGLPKKHHLLKGFKAGPQVRPKVDTNIEPVPSLYRSTIVPSTGFPNFRVQA